MLIQPFIFKDTHFINYKNKLKVVRVSLSEVYFLADAIFIDVLPGTVPWCFFRSKMSHRTECLFRRLRTRPPIHPPFMAVRNHKKGLIAPRASPVNSISLVSTFIYGVFVYLVFKITWQELNRI